MLDFIILLITAIILIKILHYIISKTFKILIEWEESQCYQGEHDYIPIGRRKWKCKKCGKRIRR